MNEQMHTFVTAIPDGHQVSVNGEVDIAKHIDRRHGKFVIHGTPPAQLRIFEMTGLDAYLRLDGDQLSTHH